MNEKLIKSILDNIKADRTFSSTLLTDIMNYLMSDSERYKMAGAVASKFLDNLQRSNEQLLKLYETLKKADTSPEYTGDISEEEVEDIFNEIQEAQNEAREQREKLKKQ